jgi:hypothetical protein
LRIKSQSLRNELIKKEIRQNARQCRAFFVIVLLRRLLRVKFQYPRSFTCGSFATYEAKRAFVRNRLLALPSCKFGWFSSGNARRGLPSKRISKSFASLTTYPHSNGKRFEKSGSRQSERKEFVKNFRIVRRFVTEPRTRDSVRLFKNLAFESRNRRAAGTAAESRHH